MADPATTPDPASPPEGRTTDSRRFATELFDGLPPRYDRLAAVLSLGQDRRWRRATVERFLPDRSAQILDVATGPGGVAFALRRRTGSNVVGLDLTWPMLEAARRNAETRQDDRFFLVQASGDALPFSDRSFDGLTFTYLLRYVPDPVGTVRELARVVRPGGVMASLEFHRPDTPFWRGMWWCYTRGVLPMAGLLTGGPEWFRVGRFLGPNISGHYRRHPVTETIEAWQQAGMVDIGVRRMSLGGGLVMWGTKSDAADAG